MSIRRDTRVAELRVVSQFREKMPGFLEKPGICNVELAHYRITSYVAPSPEWMLDRDLIRNIGTAGIYDPNRLVRLVKPFDRLKRDPHALQFYFSLCRLQRQRGSGWFGVLAS